MIWFTSDSHFGHKSVIRFCDRPFKDLRAMELEMITRWNRRVGINDTVIVVGDFCFWKKRPKYWNRMPEMSDGFHIHGHTHSKKGFVGRELHVGVDAHDFYPISIKQIEKHIHQYTSALFPK